MSTVAFKNGMIAFDALDVENGVIIAFDANREMDLDGNKFFFAGSFIESGLMARMFTDEKISDTVLKDSEQLERLDGSEILIVTRELRVLKMTIDKRYGVIIKGISLDTPAAIGTGATLALGAMLAGASAEEAVNIASQRDPLTGNEVKMFYHSRLDTRTKDKAHTIADLAIIETTDEKLEIPSMQPREGIKTSIEEKLQYAPQGAFVKDEPAELTPSGQEVMTKRVANNAVSGVPARGAHSKRKRPVRIKGTLYPSITAAAKALKHSKQTIVERCDSKTEESSQWQWV